MIHNKQVLRRSAPLLFTFTALWAGCQSSGLISPHSRAVTGASASKVAPSDFDAYESFENVQVGKKNKSLKDVPISTILKEVAGPKKTSLFRKKTALDPYLQFRYRAPGRVVAIGDLHGDFVGTTHALLLAGAIDTHWNWIGGNLVVVQTGDVLDRGDEDRKVLDALEDLAGRAHSAGGQLIVLNGNHEIMNVALDMRYVSPKSFAEFADFPLSPFYLGNHLRLPDQSTPGMPDFNNPHSGVIQRALAFGPTGHYARILANHPLFAIVNDTVYVHGGITPLVVDYGLPRFNHEIQDWMLGKTQLPELINVAEDDNPLWSRLYSNGNPPPQVCQTLMMALNALKVKRMVVGHTVQPQINAVCGNAVFRIDVGFSNAYAGMWHNGVSPLEVLEINQEKISILRPGYPRP